jgi:hypothetical protein
VGFKRVAYTKLERHRLFDEFRTRMTGQPSESFYVESKSGTTGWVPWVGSPVVWPWEAAWEADLLEGSESDFREKDVKK